jgi:RAP domain
MRAASSRSLRALLRVQTLPQPPPWLTAPTFVSGPLPSSFWQHRGGHSTSSTRMDRTLHPHASPWAINAALIAAQTPAEALQTAADAGNLLNAVNQATLLHRLAKAVRSEQCTLGPEDMGRLRLVQDAFLSLLQRDLVGDRALATTLWSAAVLHSCGVSLNDGFAVALVKCAHNRVHFFSEQSLANASYAAALLKLPGSAEFVLACWRAARACFPGFAPQGIAQMVWAAATLKVYPGAVSVDVFLRQLVLRSSEFKHLEIGQIAWALAELKHRPPRPVFDALDASMAEEVTCCSAQTLSNTLWACAVLGHMPARILAALSEPDAVAHVHALLAEPEASPIMARDAAVLSFSCAVLGAFNTPVFHAAWKTACALPPTAFSPEGLCMLFQTTLLAAAARADGANLNDAPLPCLPAPLDSACEHMWRTFAVAKPTVSDYHTLVSRALDAMSVPHTLEGRTHDGLLSIDVVIQGTDIVVDATTGAPATIALEVDGPSHFAVNTRTPLARTRARNALLRFRGWTVVSVPYFEWRLHNRSVGNQMAYLKSKLEQDGRVLVRPPADELTA